jgi:hypothetical protein
MTQIEHWSVQIGRDRAHTFEDQDLALRYAWNHTRADVFTTVTDPRGDALIVVRRSDIRQVQLVHVAR